MKSPESLEASVARFTTGCIAISIIIAWMTSTMSRGPDDHGWQPKSLRRVSYGNYRILMHAEHCRQGDFQAYLCLLRNCYLGRRIWLLLDEAPCHTAILSQVLAAQLDIVFVWLPKQCSELNAMDQLWKELKDDLAANRQFKNIDEAVDYADGLRRAPAAQSSPYAVTPHVSAAGWRHWRKQSGVQSRRRRGGSIAMISHPARACRGTASITRQYLCWCPGIALRGGWRRRSVPFVLPRLSGRLESIRRH